MSCFSGISSLNRCEIVALADAVSLALSEGLDNDDLNTLGNLLVSIGSVMTTFATLQQSGVQNKT